MRCDCAHRSVGHGRSGGATRGYIPYWQPVVNDALFAIDLAHKFFGPIPKFLLGCAQFIPLGLLTRAGTRWAARWPSSRRRSARVASSGTASFSQLLHYRRYDRVLITSNVIQGADVSDMMVWAGRYSVLSVCRSLTNYLGRSPG